MLVYIHYPVPAISKESLMCVFFSSTRTDLHNRTARGDSSHSFLPIDAHPGDQHVGGEGEEVQFCMSMCQSLRSAFWITDRSMESFLKSGRRFGFCMMRKSYALSSSSSLEGSRFRDLRQCSSSAIQLSCPMTVSMLSFLFGLTRVEFE